ncbi:TetR/AcrR family transcriptional regulator [Actinomadura sediminis]|uniref:TetR/AcrR family transcriptional regulator n=1 Tax=Actinomadura sediminis TaxID=1038904 RepID=UPI00366BA510
MTSENAASAAGLRIRPPRQERSRQVWARIPDVGVQVVEEGGYEAFTIAAVCGRADVAPPTVYARVDTKDALFLAVYEHGIAQVSASQEVFSDQRRWDGLAPERLVREAVTELAGVFFRHVRFLRAVVLISGAHPEVERRGSVHARRLGEEFTAVLLRAADRIAPRTRPPRPARASPCSSPRWYSASPTSPASPRRRPPTRSSPRSSSRSRPATC